MQILKIYLDDLDGEALKTYSRTQRRNPGSQGALIIHDFLVERNILPRDNSPDQPVRSIQPQHSQAAQP